MEGHSIEEIEVMQKISATQIENHLDIFDTIVMHSYLDFFKKSEEKWLTSDWEFSNNSMHTESNHSGQEP